METDDGRRHVVLHAPSGNVYIVSELSLRFVM